MENRLINIYNQVNHWIEFAEAKNAGLIAINVGIIAAILNSKILDELFFLKSMISIGFLLSIIVSLWTLIPITKKIYPKKKKKKRMKNDNLLFFKDIAKYEWCEYIEALNIKYFNNKETISELHNDYAKEIVENSKNAMRKYNGFNVSLKLDIITVLIFLISLILA